MQLNTGARTGAGRLEKVTTPYTFYTNGCGLKASYGSQQEAWEAVWDDYINGNPWGPWAGKKHNDTRCPCMSCKGCSTCCA